MNSLTGPWELLGAVATSVVVAAIFVLLGELMFVLRKRLPNGVPFAELLHEPGNRERRALDDHRRRFIWWLSGATMLPLVAFSIWAVDPALFREDATWMLRIPILVGVAMILAYGLFQLVLITKKKRQLTFRYTAKLAVAQALRRVSSRGFAVFHDVVIDGQLLDAVVAGGSGVYVVNVITRRCKRDQDPVAFDGSSLHFDEQDETEAVRRIKGAARRLEQALRTKTGSDNVVVYPGLVVPGWTVQCASGVDMPVVSEKNVDLLTSWKKPESYLLDEELAAVQRSLSDWSRSSD